MKKKSINKLKIVSSTNLVDKNKKSDYILDVAAFEK